MIPNRFLRTAVTNFRSETGYTKAVPPPTDKTALPVTELAALSPAPELEPVPSVDDENTDDREEPELILEVK